jgi:hypothetical protein
MKNIYSRIKDILSEATKSTAGVMSLSDPKYQKFKQGEGPVDKDLEKTVDPRLERGRVAVYDPAKGKNVVVSKSSPTPGQLEKIPEVQPREASAIKPRMKATYTPKKELSPFEKEFARARAAGEKEFTWKNKEGKSYQVGTKLKGEVKAPEAKKSVPVKKSSNVDTSLTRSVKSDTSSKSGNVPDTEMKDIDIQKANADRRAEDMARIRKDADTMDIKPAEKTDDEKKSDELWKDIRQELENETPEQAAARDERIKEYKKQMNIKTNEENQMSINKKFNVSDSLYSAVMEVMKKPSQGSIPRHEKEKKLAAMHGDPDVITHGDILKARGVKMKEDVTLPVKEQSDVTKKIMDVADAIGGLFTGDTAKKMMEPKKDEKTGMDQANQGKANQKSDQSKKDKTVKEGTMRNGKYVDDAPRPGTSEVPVPDEGYRGPGKPLYTPIGGKKPGKKAQPGSTTKAMDVEEQEMRLIKKSDEKIVPDTSEVIRARTMKNQAAIDAMGPSMKARSEYILKQDAADPSSKYHDAAKKVLSDRKSAVKEENVQEMSSKQKMKLGLYNKKKSAVKENTDTPGNSYEHQCAIHVKSESFGEGRTITTQHADVDENGHIAWYDVMFEHGIEKYVPTDELEILVSESHMHSMKKKKK